MLTKAQISGCQKKSTHNSQKSWIFCFWLEFLNAPKMHRNLWGWTYFDFPSAFECTCPPVQSLSIYCIARCSPARWQLQRKTNISVWHDKLLRRGHICLGLANTVARFSFCSLLQMKKLPQQLLCFSISISSVVLVVFSNIFPQSYRVWQEVKKKKKT